MPFSKPVTVRCVRCGREYKVLRAPGQEDSGYWICPECKRKLEATPKELVRHAGKAVEKQFQLKESRPAA